MRYPKISYKSWKTSKYFNFYYIFWYHKTSHHLNPTQSGLNRTYLWTTADDDDDDALCTTPALLKNWKKNFALCSPASGKNRAVALQLEQHRIRALVSSQLASRPRQISWRFFHHVPRDNFNRFSVFSSSDKSSLFSCVNSHWIVMTFAPAEHCFSHFLHIDDFTIF